MFWGCFTLNFININTFVHFILNKNLCSKWKLSLAILSKVSPKLIESFGFKKSYLGFYLINSENGQKVAKWSVSGKLSQLSTISSPPRHLDQIWKLTCVFDVIEGGASNNLGANSAFWLNLIQKFMSQLPCRMCHYFNF